MSEPTRCIITLNDAKVSTLTCQRQGEHLLFFASCPYFPDGVYRLYVANAGKGAEGFLIGVLSPENGRLTIRKKISARELQKGGVDPDKELSAYLGIRRFDISAEKDDEPDYFPLLNPGEIVHDEALLSALAASKGVLYRGGGGRHTIIVPFDGKSPIGIAPAFSVSKIFSYKGKIYAGIDVSNGSVQTDGRTDT